MANKINPMNNDNQGETSPYLMVEWQPVQTRTPNWLSLKQNGHLIVSFFIATPGWKIYCVFVGILDGWPTKVKSLVPIDESSLIGEIYHNYVIDL